MSDGALPDEFPERPVGGSVTLSVRHDGTARELLRIVLVNFALSVLTLTLYRFWARTRVRRYLWDHTLLNDEPLEYTGTGKELFLGFLLILVIVFLPLALVGMGIGLFVQNQITQGLVTMSIYLLLLFLMGAAQYRARRFRLSRTYWRGIRFAQGGSWITYGLKYFGFMLLAFLTLGWSYPWQMMRLTAQEMNNTWLGGEQFQFKGSARHLYGRFAAIWFGGGIILFIFSFGAIGLISLITGEASTSVNFSLTGGMTFKNLVGVVIFYFYMMTAMTILSGLLQAKYLQLLMSSTKVQGLTFNLGATAWSFVGMEFGNLLITFFTFGVGLPFAQLRRFRYFCDRLSIQGVIDLDNIQQSTHDQPGLGEGLADAFDLGSV